MSSTRILVAEPDSRCCSPPPVLTSSARKLLPPSPSNERVVLRRHVAAVFASASTEHIADCCRSDGAVHAYYGTKLGDRPGTNGSLIVPHPVGRSDLLLSPIGGASVPVRHRTADPWNAPDAEPGRRPLALKPRKARTHGYRGPIGDEFFFCFLSGAYRSPIRAPPIDAGSLLDRSSARAVMLKSRTASARSPW